MGRRTIISSGVFVAIAASIALANYVLVQRQLTGVINADKRNSGITAFAHYEYFVVPSSLVFDLRKLSGDKSPADVTRVLLQFAESMQDSTFERITLSHRGRPKFFLTGKFFHAIGSEYGTQNPVYTMRTFPENVYKLDGRAAFGTWTGGWLGVIGKQMDDFNEFHKQWYIEDIARNGS